MPNSSCDGATETDWKCRVVNAVFQVLVMNVCRANETTATWKTELHNLVENTISIRTPNNYKKQSKLYDIEIRTCPALFHRYNGKSNSNTLVVSSHFGVRRTFASSLELATFLLPEIETELRSIHCATHIRIASSGFLCVATHTLVAKLQRSMIPCAFCPKWFDKAKQQGYWWHLQQQHDTPHCMASSSANWLSTRDSTAIVVYNPDSLAIPTTEYTSRTTSECVSPTRLAINNLSTPDDPWSCVKRGSLADFKIFLLDAGIASSFHIETTRDNHGAVLLHWAAGGGHLDICMFLVEELGCDIAIPQSGRRAFDGRTALHWACRNGHIHVVEYLVSHGANLEAATSDGTTAFCWAAWQGHLEILKLLHKNNVQLNSVNSFGCNAVLWAAQGTADLAVVKFLAAIGCHVKMINHSGHGFLHKAAQRGNEQLARWFIDSVGVEIGDIGPDQDGCTPSDLAGMEHHTELAEYLSAQERRIAVLTTGNKRPNWLTPFSCTVEDDVWESGGGVLRMRNAVVS